MTKNVADEKVLTPPENKDIMKNDVLAVGYARIDKIDRDFPELKREDFASDTEYAKALQQQYLALRQQEYEYICKQQAYEIYNASRCVSDAKCRSIMFSAVTGIAEGTYEVIDADEPSSLEEINQSGDYKYKFYAHSEDSTVVNNAGKKVYSVHQTTEKKPTTENHHCAMTGLRIVKGISDCLGYRDGTNFTDGAGAGANAGLIHGRHAGLCSVQKKHAVQKGKYSVAVKGKTLKQLILSGEIGPGDIISTGDDNGSGNPNKVHGYHTLTIASINKDEKGNIVSYTLMDNNGGKPKTRLETHNINGSFGRNQVLYTKTHEWANDMFSKEIQGKSAEELQQMILGAKERIYCNRIPDLTRQEITLMCDETYLKSSGRTNKGVIRAPYLKKQQENFRKFYYEQNADLIVLGKENIEDVSKNYSIDGSERKVLKTYMRLEAYKYQCVNLNDVVAGYSVGQNPFSGQLIKEPTPMVYNNSGRINS